MEWNLLFSFPLLTGCLLILYSNALFTRLNVHDFLLNTQIKATSAFMAAGGMLLFIQCAYTTPILRTTGDLVPSDIAETICSENSTNSSLPTDWFEEVTERFDSHIVRFQWYCLWIFLLATYLAVPKVMFFIREVGKIRILIPFATTIMLTRDDPEVRKNAIVELMMGKLKYLKLNVFSFMAWEFAYFCVALVGLKIQPGNPSRYEDLAVRLNESEWLVDCDRKITSQDVYSLVKCQYNYTDSKYDGLCIVPTNTIYFYLHIAIWWSFALLAVISINGITYRIYEIIKFGRRRANDMMLVWLLKKNVPYRNHKLIIDAFEVKLNERSRKIKEQERERRMQAIAVRRNPEGAAGPIDGAEARPDAADVRVPINIAEL